MRPESRSGASGRVLGAGLVAAGVVLAGGYAAATWVELRRIRDVFGPDAGSAAFAELRGGLVVFLMVAVALVVAGLLLLRRAGAAGRRRGGVEVREARPDEHEALGALTAQVYAAADPELARIQPAYLDRLRAVADRAAHAVVLVACDGARLLGGVTYVPGPGPYAEFSDPDAAGIRMLAVAPDAQGTGVGEALTRACVQRARHEGRARVVLHTTPRMLTAQRLYERLGFVRTPERDWEPVPGLPLHGYVRELDR